MREQLPGLSILCFSIALLVAAFPVAPPAFTQEQEAAEDPQQQADRQAQEPPAPEEATEASTAEDPRESVAPAHLETWRIRSPFQTSAQTRQLLDTIGLEALPLYDVDTEPTASRTLSGRPGIQISRFFSRRVGANVLRTVELVVASRAGGGYELYMLGHELEDGQEATNPELQEIQTAIGRLVGELSGSGSDSGSGSQEGAPSLDKRSLAYESYQLSYIEPDRAIALLKALDYSTVEFNEASGETLYDRIFMPSTTERSVLPVIIKMVSASKTSLQESTEDSGTYSYSSSDIMPDLGGTFLHRTTAAEPQNRLLIAYDPYDVESLERLVNLLRDIVDLPARQLVLEALVIEIQGDATDDLGISWGASGVLHAGRYEDTYDLSVQEEPRVVPPPLTFLFSRRSDTFNFNVSLHALLETSKAKILSNPSVLVLDGRQAKIQIGNRIPVVETTVTTTTATESVLYFPVGIVLNLRPRISDDGSEISMQVETIVSSAREMLITAGSGTRAPVVESRQVQTFVRVQNDTPFIIGGLSTTEEILTKRGVPFFSKIPLLGALFRRRVTENVRKEIIIVVTPHIVPEDAKTFSWVIPQESPIFDSFGHELLYNAYRIRQQDVFELDFLYESAAYRSLAACAQRHLETAADRTAVDPEFLSLLDGTIPGEDILVRRMLWEIVRKTDYSRFINLERMIFFEKSDSSGGGAGFELAFLADKLAARDTDRNALRMTFSATNEGTPERPFSQPTASVAYEQVTSETYTERLAAGNRRSPDGVPETWSILLSDVYSGTASPYEVLRGVIVLKAILRLNPHLPLSIREFRAGRQIVFPTESELQKSYDLIDPGIAELFYEVTSYYPAFEEEFKHVARRLVREMKGCAWWDSGGTATLSPGTGDLRPPREQTIPDGTREEPPGR